MSVTTTRTNKPIIPRGQDASPKQYNRAALYSGKALDFDGVNDYIVDQTIDVSSTSFSVSFYAKYSDHTAANSCGFSIGPSAYATGYDLVVYPFDGSLKTFRIYSQYNTDNIINDSSIPITGVFNHYVVQSDGANLSVYANGVLAASVAYDNNRTFTRFQIGKLITGTQYYVGQLSNFKLFNTALTAAQVADLYNNPEKIVPTGVAESALKLWLPMMEGAGTTAYDGSGGGNHGTISGATWTHGIGAPVAQTAVIDWNKASNILDNSENFSGWTTQSGTTITSDSIAAPDGLTTADTITSSASTVINQRQVISSMTSGADYVFSVWLKKKSTNTIQVYAFDTAGSGFVSRAEINLTNGNVTDIEGTGATAESYANDWYRVSVYFNAPSNSISHGIFSDTAVGVDVYAWGAQLEQSDTLGAYVRTGATAQTSDVLLPQGLTSGRDITGVNLFENVRKQGALNLDGNSWAEVHDNASLDITDAITLEAWVYWSDPSSEGILGRFGALTADRSYMLYAFDTTEVQFFINTGQSNYTSMTNGWRHIVGTYDGANRKLYVDGVLRDNDAIATTITTSDKPIEIGRYRHGSVANLEHKDQIAQPRIYNRALTAEEVARNYDAGKNIYTNS